MKLPDWMKDTPENRKYFERVYETVMDGDNICQNVDGFYMYFPDKEEMMGGWSSNDLKCIAWILEELNRPWDEQINEYFENSIDNITATEINFDNE